MKKVLKIQGLDCAHCAKVLEDEINSLECIKKAQVNFVQSTITFESQNIEEATQKIINVTKMVEPDAKILEKEVKINKHGWDKTLIINLITICIGTILGLCGALIEGLPLWAFCLLFVGGLLILGYKTYYKAIKLLFKGIINENFLITISVIGISVLQILENSDESEWKEAVMVVALYSIGKILESLAVNKSRNSITELTDLNPDYAILVKNGKETKVNPKEVKIGETILVRTGERIPIDGIITQGDATLDTQNLTGESLPVIVKKNSEVLSGSLVIDGVIQIKTTSAYPNTTISRIMDLIENASEKKSKTETFISKFTRWYTLIVLFLSALSGIIAWCTTKDVSYSVELALTLLVTACPCAFAISVPLAYFSGIGNASSKGILIKGSNYLDACAKVNVVAFDKTGTLTTGKFSVEDVKIEDTAYTKEQIIQLASIGEQYSLHPLAKSIVSANTLPLEKAVNVKEKSGVGVTFTYKNQEYFVGRKSKDLKNTAVELFLKNKLLGTIFLADSLKEHSYMACHELREMNIKTVLLSGDNAEIVNDIANKVEIKEYYGKLLPQDKYEWIVKQKENKDCHIGYVGDGINDAPSLIASDVGISMGINASGASIESSDIVLVDDNPQKVSMAVKISKFTRRIVLENIIMASGFKIAVWILALFGIASVLLAVIADVGITLVAVLNSMRALYYKPRHEHCHHDEHCHDEHCACHK